jgi:prepilin-type N-terminal cleavage/methylation domain-containing protein
MKQKGFTLIELLVVVAIIGILAAVGTVAYEGYIGVAKDSAVKTNCRQAVSAIEEKFAFCTFNSKSTIALKSIGGRQTIENVPCDKNKTNTSQMLIKIVNHLNNEGYKNPYGNIGGLVQGIIGPIGAHQASTGLWWQDLMIKGNNYDNMSLGRCVVQHHTNGEIGVTGFYDKGTFRVRKKAVTEALKWTPLMMTMDMRS